MRWTEYETNMWSFWDMCRVCVTSSALEYGCKPNLRDYLPMDSDRIVFSAMSSFLVVLVSLEN